MVWQPIHFPHRDCLTGTMLLFAVDCFDVLALLPSSCRLRFLLCCSNNGSNAAASNTVNKLCQEGIQPCSEPSLPPTLPSQYSLFACHIPTYIYHAYANRVSSTDQQDSSSKCNLMAYCMPLQSWKLCLSRSCMYKWDMFLWIPMGPSEIEVSYPFCLTLRLIPLHLRDRLKSLLETIWCTVEICIIFVSIIFCIWTR